MEFFATLLVLVPFEVLDPAVGLLVGTDVGLLDGDVDGVLVGQCLLLLLCWWLLLLLILLLPLIHEEQLLAYQQVALVLLQGGSLS